MTEQLERDLRHLFAEDAERAPTSVDLLQTVRGRAQRRTRPAVAWGAGMLAAASVAGVVLLSGSLFDAQPPDGQPMARPTTAVPASPSAAAGPTGALPIDAPLAMCRVYSPELAAADMDVAFDGTVTAIGETRPKRQGRVGPQIVTTFVVHEWFRGGSASTITVDIPVLSSHGLHDGGAPPFEVGTRLLIGGTRPYVPKNYAVHVWGCGYTRYYDKDSAESWRAAFD